MRSITVAGICLGVAAIVSIGIVNNRWMFSFEDSINRVTGRAALQVIGSAAGFRKFSIERVQNVQGVEYAVPVIDTRGILLAPKKKLAPDYWAWTCFRTAISRDYKLSDARTPTSPTRSCFFWTTGLHTAYPGAC